MPSQSPSEALDSTSQSPRPSRCIDTITNFNVCYALDESGSVTSLNYEIVKNFAVNVTRVLTTKANSNSVTFGSSVVEFGTGATVASPLTTNPSVTVAALQGLVYNGGGTDLTTGIRTCSSTFTAANTGEKNFIMIVTDGEPDSENTALAVKHSAEAQGTSIIPVFIFNGRGSTPYEFMEELSTNGEVYYTSFVGLSKIVDDMSKEVIKTCYP